MLGGIRAASKLRPVVSTLHYTPVRCFGISDSIMNFASRTVENKQEQTFAKSLDAMVGAKKWTLSLWRGTLVSSLDSWLMKIPGVSNKDQVESVKKYKSILDAMTPDELENHDLIKASNRSRIARASNSTEEEVAKCLYYFKSTIVVQKWLVMKKAANEPLPKTESELQQMQEDDPRVQKIAKEVLHPDGVKRHGRGRGLRF